MVATKVTIDDDEDDSADFYGWGDFWLVKSEKVFIQARYRKVYYPKASEPLNHTYLTAVAVSGPFLQGPTLSGPVLRDTARLSQRNPPIARYGVFAVSTWPIECDTPSPFSLRFPLGEHAKWRCDTPPTKGVSAILA